MDEKQENHNEKKGPEIEENGRIGEDPSVDGPDGGVSPEDGPDDANSSDDLEVESESVADFEEDQSDKGDSVDGSLDEGSEDMERARSEEESSDEMGEEEKSVFNPEIDEELEAKLEEELKKKKKKQKKGMSEQDLIEYLSSRRNKIQYHALWHLVFNVEDHAATKKGLYDALKEVTSKDPVEPIDEHKFYFGLGFILRLELNGKKIVKFKAGKLAIDVNIEKLKKILEIVGDPISERPIITEKEKEEMFQEFLKDDFLNDF